MKARGKRSEPGTDTCRERGKHGSLDRRQSSLTRSGCWSTLNNKRISLPEVMKHPWISSLKDRARYCVETKQVITL
uniref:Uncharacterized protein n=1 Tax=Timema poppense TaxID=170557 RepID=A0A7R9HGK3_TIMPO|nr:unnamed protein product [Timema poppensis]